MVNINLEIFRRTSPEKKKAIIENLTEDELLNIRESTIIRIIKEVGTGYEHKQLRNSNKYLRLMNSASNDWNADIESIWYYKKRLGLTFYLQYDNTDTSTEDYYSEFVRYSEYRGEYEYEDRYGGKQTTYFRFNLHDKANFYRILLLTYLSKKYSNKD